MLIAPPNNVEAERSLVSCLFVDPGCYYQITTYSLREHNFYNKPLGAIYGAIEKLIMAGKAVDFVTVGDQVQQDERDLCELSTYVISTSGVAEYARIVHENSMYRKLMARSQKLIAVCNDKKPMDEVMSLAEKVYQTTLHKADSVSFNASLDGFRNDLKVGAQASLPSGYTMLDKLLTGGGFKRGQLVCIAGRPGTGKSSVMNCFMVKQSLNFKVAMFSLEMMSREIAYRLVALKTQVPYSVIDNGETNWDPATFKKIDDGFEWLKDGEIAVYDKLFTHQQIVSEMRRLKVTSGLDFVYIDYLQLIAQTDQDVLRSMFIGQVTRMLKQVAKELEIVIFIGSQLNREVEKRREIIPKLADLRESGDIEQDCDVVIFLSNEDEDEPMQQKNLTIAKQRNGVKGVTLEMDFKGDTMTLFDRKHSTFAVMKAPSGGLRSMDEIVDGMDW